MTDTRDLLESAAIDLAHQLFTRLVDIENFGFVSAAELRSEILASASLHVRNLHHRRGDTENEGSARVTCRALHGLSDPPAGFWATKVGRDVAWAIGYPLHTAPVWAVVAVLGSSRSYVHRLIRENTLTTGDNGEVFAMSLRDYARRTPAPSRGGVKAE